MYEDACTCKYPLTPPSLSLTWSLERRVRLFLGGVRIGSSRVNSSSKLLMSVLLFCSSKHKERTQTNNASELEVRVPSHTSYANNTVNQHIFACD